MKNMLPLILAFFSAVTAAAQTMDSLFASAPQEVLPMLEKNARLNLLDYYNSGMEGVAENDFGGVCVLKEKTDSTILLQTTEASELSIVWLRDRRLLLCLHTLQLPSRQTYLDVYDESWSKRGTPMRDFKTKDFFRGTDAEYASERFQSVIRGMTPIHYTMAWDSARRELVCTPSFDRVLESDIDIARKYFGKRTVRLKEAGN